MVFSSTTPTTPSGREEGVLGADRDVPRLDVPVVGELLPDDLDRGAEHDVRPVGGLARRTTGVLPPAFEREAASMHASEEPTVDTPIVRCGSGEFHNLARMRTQRPSIAAVSGYSSLSIMFLSADSANSRRACGSIQVVTKVARFCRAWPSSNVSSWTICTPSQAGLAVGQPIPRNPHLAPAGEERVDGDDVARDVAVRVLRLHHRLLPQAGFGEPARELVGEDEQQQPDDRLEDADRRGVGELRDARRRDRPCRRRCR